MTTLPASDANGAPLPGLMLTWAVCVDAESGASATMPDLVELGSGMYAADAPDAVAGIIDLGTPAHPRYVVLASPLATVVGAFDATGAPLPGLAPTWASWRVAATGADATPGPVVTELSGGLYRVESPPDDEVGVLDLGATASPRYVTVGQPTGNGGGDDPTPPVVTILAPLVGAPIGRTQPIRLRVTDNAGLRNVILYMRFSGQQASEVVHDGCCFLAPYTQGSRRTDIAGGYEFTLMRGGGWHGSPSLSVRAFDTAGNEGQ